MSSKQQSAAPPVVKYPLTAPAAPTTSDCAVGTRTGSFAGTCTDLRRHCRPAAVGLGLSACRHDVRRPAPESRPGTEA